MNDDNIKQVIIIRRDLKMRRGKEIAQGAHASQAFLIDIITNPLRRLTEEHIRWLNGTRTKICLQIESEKELLKLYNAAIKNSLECHLIEDLGLTEFNGIATKTCLAIGPNYSEKIDAITSHLKLY